MSSAATLVILYCIATALAIVVRKLRVPYTVALVIVGLGLGSLALIEPPKLTQDLLFTFFLPGLLFESAFHLDRQAFGGVWRSAVALAVPGVALGVAITTGMVLLAAQLVGAVSLIDPALALMFGAIVAATDPVAVTALFRELETPATLATLVEAESLFNDGTGVVAFSLVLAHVTGKEAGVVAGVTTFVVVGGGGVACGAVVGWALSKVIQRVDEAVIEIGLTVIAAYGSFVLADRVGASGVLATVAAGILCGLEGRDRGMSTASRAAAHSFWEYIAFALNSIIFLLIGFQFHAPNLRSAWRLVVLSFLAMLVARFVIVAVLFSSRRMLRQEMPLRWAPVIACAGLRGALSMVLALSLPFTLPGRQLLVTLTVGVVLLSIVIQGLAMPWLIRRLDAQDQVARFGAR